MKCFLCSTPRPRRACVVNYLADGVCSDTDDILLTGTPSMGKVGKKFKFEATPNPSNFSTINNDIRNPFAIMCVGSADIVREMGLGVDDHKVNQCCSSCSSYISPFQPHPSPSPQYLSLSIACVSRICTKWKEAAFSASTKENKLLLQLSTLFFLGSPAGSKDLWKVFPSCLRSKMEYGLNHTTNLSQWHTYFSSTIFIIAIFSTEKLKLALNFVGLSWNFWVSHLCFFLHCDVSWSHIQWMRLSN